MDDSEQIIEAVGTEAVRERMLAPVMDGGDDERLWMDCDLASLAENRLGDRTDPRELDDARRQSWLGRASSNSENGWWLPSQRKYDDCYWLLAGGERAGTLALGTSTLGGTRVRVSSLYALPAYRNQGIAKRALLRLREKFASHGLGIRLATEWSWQRSVAYYMHLGMWVRGWKREVDFQWDPGAPAPEVEVGERYASLYVTLNGCRTLLACAERDEEKLVRLDVASEDSELDPLVRELRWEADGTLALHLAMHAWPLVRSAKEWEESRHSDFGSPESLAYKIAIWEAWDRKHGWKVETSKIPGLEYPTWDELEARWKAKEVAVVGG